MFINYIRSFREKNEKMNKAPKVLKKWVKIKNKWMYKHQTLRSDLNMFPVKMAYVVNIQSLIEIL